MKKRVILLAIFLVVFSINLVSAMSITVNSPTNGTFYDSNSVLFNVTLNENGRCEFSVDSGINNYTMSSIDNLNWNATKSLVDRNYTCHFYCNDTVGSINNTTTSFYVDTLFPNITSQTPANNSNVSKTNGNISFSVNYTEANLNYTKLYWKNLSDSVYRETNFYDCASGTSKSCSKEIDFSSFSYGVNISYFFSLTDAVFRNTNGSVYIFSLICTPSWGCTSWSDSSNACGTRTCTDSNSCGTNTDKPSESQSCSDSTENTNTQNTVTIQNINYFLTESQLNNGSLRTLRLVGDKIAFKIKNESHVLELRKIFSDKVSIKVSSVEQYANLTLNEVKKFDLTADKYYDISVTLKRLNSSEADILINTTNEKVPETLTTTNTNATGNISIETNNTISTLASNETESFGSRIIGGFLGTIENLKETSSYLLIIFAAVISGLFGVTIFMFLRKRKRKKSGHYK